MTDLLVAGGTVLTPDGSVRADVTVAAGRIAGVARRSDVAAAEPTEGTPRLDATGLVVAPGFVDLQCNGAVGIDLTAEPDRLWDVAAALPRWGVTAWLPTIVTSSPAARVGARATLAAGPPAFGVPVAHPLGLHLEGPFLAPDHRGAHDPGLIVPPSPALVAAEGWSRHDGVALVTLAPERPGALDVVRELVARGVVVAAGHTAATAVEATAAIDAGVRAITHLFNAMAPLHHREPGLAGVALTDDRVHVGLIADGVHVVPTVVTLAARLLGPRLALVTDAAAALGAPPGTVRLGGLTATVSEADGAVRLDDGTLAGSTLALDRAVRNLMVFAGVSLAEAVRAVTAVPAALLGLADRGVVAPGAVGDLVVLTPDGHVVATVVAGRLAHGRAPSGGPPWRS
jgi:N-acetylglucosamine-6-phosphate deacetylase